MYKFFQHLNIGPSVYFYVDQKMPECLLIATADGNSTADAKFSTVSCCSQAELSLITIDQKLLIRIIEVIFFIKDLLSNHDNFGLIPSQKRILIIDFSILRDELNSFKSTPASRMIYSNLPIPKSLALTVIFNQYNGSPLGKKI